ncbi:MAG: phosphatase PAP2 family protein [Bacteroidaceae bacterium]|nr:phosphatase PAP2 family protein [Bacteroidaceae bacterium]
MAIMAPWLADSATMLVTRVGWFAMTAALVVADHLYTSRLEKVALAHPSGANSVPQPAKASFHFPFFPFLRTAAQLAWLILWYPDTYEFNRSFPNLDHLFAAADQTLFGCQPSLEFSQAMPQPFWSEAFNLGYWSYYPMMAVLVLVVFIKAYNARSRNASVFNLQVSAFKSVSALIIASFFLFYVIYIFLPVAGPQFYFEAVGIDNILCGRFPALGTYFTSHTAALAPPGYTDGFFYQLVASAQEAGERPTAAFPSSHIGVSTIVLLLSRRHAPKLLYLFLPLWLLLCCATVYIRAHYLVDAIAGLVSAPVILWLAQKVCRPLIKQG